jgi:hypothetical protein
MRAAVIIGSAMLFGGCLPVGGDDSTAAPGASCTEDGATSCGDWPTDTAGYVCTNSTWVADTSCECAEQSDGSLAVQCVDTAIGFVGVTRARSARQ